MSKLGGSIRLAGIVALLAVSAPVQALCLKISNRAAGLFPVFVYRTALRILRVRVTTRGAAPNGNAVLVVSNHVSWLDIVVVGSLQPSSFIAKAEIAKWPVFGLFARLQRSIFIDRERRGATIEANGAIAERLNDGGAVILFAEGTTGDGRSLLPFRSSLVGAAQAALREKNGQLVEIKPLALRYTRRYGLPLNRRDRPQVAWYGDMELVPHLWNFLRGGPLDVTVSWCAPIQLSAGSDRKRVTAAAETAVQRVLRER